MSPFAIVIFSFVKLRTAIAQLPKQAGRVDPDVLQTSTPALVSSQGVFAVLKRSWRALQCPTKVLKDLTK